MGAMRFANGAIGTISATTCAYPGFPDAIDIIGTKGTARLEGTTLAVKFRTATRTSLDDGTAGWRRGADPMAFSHDYHRAVLPISLTPSRQVATPKVTGREALKVHRLIDAILKAAESGKREPV